MNVTMKTWLILIAGHVAFSAAVAQPVSVETYSKDAENLEVKETITQKQESSETNRNELNLLDIITVIGTRGVSDTAGSITYISPEQLSIQNYTDINRVLRSVPGVNLQEEDGYGLFPNIGIRGSGTDRSGKVLFLEDGIPIMPAPFSAPSAYYFPSIGRINAVEVTKSVGAVKYGPITTAGTIQFFSTPIPKDSAAHATILGSSLDRSSVHAWVGKRIETQSLPFDVGFLLETYQDNADGFKQIDIGSTGYSIEDYVGKLGFYSKESAAVSQSLLLKVQYSKEDGDETYLGLTQEDFNRTPLLRYRASQLDNIAKEHKTYQAIHNVAFTNNVQLTTIAYRTEFARNWEKLDRFDNSALSDLVACNSLNEILVDPLTCAQEYQVLLGPDGYTSPDDVLGIRQNNRVYFAQGLQSALGIEFETGGLAHNLVTSVRYHEDGVDRFQEQDQYRIDNGFVIKTTDNEPGSQANRLSSAKSIAVFMEDTITTGPWAFTGGLRLEKITTEQLRWATPDRNLAPSSVRTNAFNVWLPSLGVTYDIRGEGEGGEGGRRGGEKKGKEKRKEEKEREGEEEEEKEGRERG
ncbi:MAG: TonB-dependent receptor plug domain-containing protein [Proteobacteria bacterium]|nr:TonB-dependent receptor plug domain-containing protein [Pseudomonadota bacterium]